MRLFGSGGDKQQDQAAQDRQEASRLSIEQGGLPLNAIDRLQEQASRRGTPGHLFTSDLSVNELSLVHHAGYEVLGQVMGSSVYHVGWQLVLQSGQSGEMDVITRAYYEARHRAFGRLQQEAALLGATGVVGVRLERKEYAWGESMIEFAALGTAIREKDVSPQPKADKPFLSDLSGQDFWVLRQAGFRPVGFAFGNCTYYETGQAWTIESQNWGMDNFERRSYTQAVYTARSLAMQRMEAEARAVSATGIVGADIKIEAEKVDDKGYGVVFHFTATGTTIAPFVGRWPIFSVLNVVPLK